MICLWLSPDEADRVRDRVADLPDIVAQIPATSTNVERLLPCDRPRLSIWTADGIVEDVHDEALAAEMMVAIKDAHRTKVKDALRVESKKPRRTA